MVFRAGFLADKVQAVKLTLIVTVFENDKTHTAGNDKSETGHCDLDGYVALYE